MGRLDVDAMLTEMTPEEFDEWIAYSTLEPFDDGWMQAGIVASTTQNAVLSVAASFGGKKMKPADFVEPADFMPGDVKRKRKRKRMTPAQAREHMESKAKRWQ